MEFLLETQAPPLINQLRALIERAAETYNELRDVEQEMRDGLPESLHDSQRAENMDDSIGCLDEVLGKLDEWQDTLTGMATDLAEVLEKSDAAKGESA